LRPKKGVCLGRNKKKKWKTNNWRRGGGHLVSKKTSDFRGDLLVPNYRGFTSRKTGKTVVARVGGERFFQGRGAKRAPEDKGVRGKNLVMEGKRANRLGHRKNCPVRRSPVKRVQHNDRETGN